MSTKANSANVTVFINAPSFVLNMDIMILNLMTFSVETIKKFTEYLYQIIVSDIRHVYLECLLVNFTVVLTSMGIAIACAPRGPVP